MSHPLVVPPGWRKGEKLRAVGLGPRYALMRDWSKEESFQRIVLNGEMTADSIAAIEFDSRDDALAFWDWWKKI